jgi:hypothetical protein
VNNNVTSEEKLDFVEGLPLHLTWRDDNNPVHPRCRRSWCLLASAVGRNREAYNWGGSFGACEPHIRPNEAHDDLEYGAARRRLVWPDRADARAQVGLRENKACGFLHYLIVVEILPFWWIGFTQNATQQNLKSPHS